LNETRGRAVFGIHKDDVFWIAPGRVNRKERDRTLDNVGQGVDGAALEEQQMARREFSAIFRIVDPERTPAGERGEMFVTACVVVRRCLTAGPELGLDLGRPISAVGEHIIAGVALIQ
jgi:hypothetical protein